MNNFEEECKNTILKVQEMLHDNNEWISRFEEYAKKIHLNLDTIRRNNQKFHLRKPLYLYMNLSAATSHKTFSLRYLGQDVAMLKVRKDKITISSKGFVDNNLRDFGCKIELRDCDWDSREASSFRSHFSAYFERTKNSKKQNEEHRIESLLLTEFSKTKSTDKILCNIQPVKLAGITRFQMPTPLSASNMNNLRYSGKDGGGIDILARIGRGNGTKLCIIEVKDENVPKEPPTKAIQQSLTYAIFIRELLRSSCGEAWWKLFGYTRNLPKKLDLYVAYAMPSNSCNNTTFADQKFEIKEDRFHLHYMYFQEKDNKASEIISSLKLLKPKS
jgi:hypothetical protein